MLAVKNMPASAGDRRYSVGPWVAKVPWRRAPHPGVLAWRIPWTEEPGGPCSIEADTVKPLSAHAGPLQPLGTCDLDGGAIDGEAGLGRPDGDSSDTLGISEGLAPSPVPLSSPHLRFPPEGRPSRLPAESPAPKPSSPIRVTLSSSHHWAPAGPGHCPPHGEEPVEATEQPPLSAA